MSQMAQKYNIDDLHTVVPLSIPVESYSKRTVTGSSYSIVHSRKRKRAEIVTGVDGEGINVYNIKNPQLLTSHPIPPQASLTAPPLCIQCKNVSSGERTRYTYAATHNELGTQKYQINCFQETLPRSSRDGAIATTSPSKYSKAVGAKNNTVVAIEALPDAQDAGRHNVLVVQEGGQISQYSADLSEEEWSISLNGLKGDDTRKADDNPGRQIVHCSTMTGLDAKKGLLRDRADLLALLSPVSQEEDDVLAKSTIICAITQLPTEGAQREEETSRIEVLSIRPRTSGVTRSPIQPLVQWDLPASLRNVEPSSTESRYWYGKESGLLYKLLNGSLTTYTFSSSGPKIFSELTLPRETIESIVPLPSDLVLASSQTTYHLLNVRYQTILASASATAAVAAQSGGRKRKRNSTNTTISAYLQDFFPNESTVVGISPTGLVGLAIRIPRSRVVSKKSRLIDSLGRGIRTDLSTRFALEVATVAMISKHVTSDPSLETLSKYLIHHSPIALSGAVEALKHLLRSFNLPTAPDLAPPTHLLTNGNITITNGVNGETTENVEEMALALEDAATDAALYLATSLLAPTSLQTRGAALKVVITLLGTTFASQPVAQVMREQLERRDILFLIELLRVELEQGGWTSHTLDVWPSSTPDDDTTDDKTPDAAITIVAKILTFAVDALGMGAWLTPSSDVNTNEEDDAMSVDDENDKPENTHTTITALRDESTLILECTQESAFFANFLGEFLRYEKALVAAKPHVQSSGRKNRGDEVKGTTVLAMPSDSLLPLGVKGVKGVEASKTKVGGEVRVRSKREIGHELSKRVGVYSFERLRV